MALTVTAVNPATGPISGGTQVTLTGTQLDTVDTIMVGHVAATILPGGTATQLKFVVPAGVATGNSPVTVIDLDASTMVTAATQFAYTPANPVEPLVITLANKYGLYVNRGSFDVPDWVKVRAITAFKAPVSKSSEDDSDFDSDDWDSVAQTSRGWTVEITVSRKRGNVSGNYDPGQQLIFAQHDVLNGLLDIMYFDRRANQTTDEAYRGYALVEWKAQGGNKTADKVDVTLTGQGARTKIANPAVTNPAYAV